MTGPWPTDVARVLARYGPAGGDGPERDGSVALVVAPGLDDGPVRRAITIAGRTLVAVESAGTVVVLPDPVLPVGRALAESVRAVPANATALVVDDGIADASRRDVLRRLARVRRVVVVTTDGLSSVLAVTEPDGLPDGEPKTTGADRVRAARAALLSTARTDSAAVEVEALRDRRRRVAATRRDAVPDPRRAAARVRVELAHRLGDARRAVTAEVSEVIDDARRVRRRAGDEGVGATVTTLVDAASTALARDTDAAVRSALGAPDAPDAPGEPTRFGRTDTTRPRPEVRWSADDGVAVVLALSAGAGAGRALTWALGVGGVPAAVLGAAVAVALTAVVTWSRRTSGRIRAERRWALEMVADTAAAWERDVAVAVMTAEADAADRAAATTREDAARREAELAGIDTEIRRVGARAAARAAAYERDLAVLDRALDEWAARGSSANREASDGRPGTESGAAASNGEGAVARERGIP
ncbi:hypothetical protein HQ602_09540 [Rhodococcus kroppenstedtii]|uniref:hypothetical protein n=1 Tax=Rhodococcoides kroppenstedtii TaxID=293050 RepID=UPI001C9A6F2E|nr:hypothetical protein [Rhodococcus kroppenstedtii]MBY6436625.1 hypothetical protein [Rhodococcus kroppenstedtii]